MALVEAGPVLTLANVQGQASIGESSQALDQLRIVVAQHPRVSDQDLIYTAGFAFGDQFDEISEFLFVSGWCFHVVISNFLSDP